MERAHRRLPLDPGDDRLAGFTDRDRRSSLRDVGWGRGSRADGGGKPGARPPRSRRARPRVARTRSAPHRDWSCQATIPNDPAAAIAGSIWSELASSVFSRRSTPRRCSPDAFGSTMRPYTSGSAVPTVRPGDEERRPARRDPRVVAGDGLRGIGAGGPGDGPGGPGAAGGPGDAGGKKEDVVDAEFTEVDDDKKNKKSA